jgi:hypothetical protein
MNMEQTYLENRRVYIPNALVEELRATGIKNFSEFCRNAAIRRIARCNVKTVEKEVQGAAYPAKTTGTEGSESGCKAGDRCA